MGIEPFLPETISPGKTGFGHASTSWEPPGPFRDHKSHTVSEDPAEPDAENDPNEANS